MMKKMRKMFGTSDGFTLLEMLVVIMIMGFLLAMLAPRFKNIFSDSEDTICDSNIRNSRQFVVGFEMSNNRLPNKMIAPICSDEDDSTLFYGPAEQDSLVDGNESFTSAILERLTLGKHVLNADEAKELADMGINTVLAYNNEGDAGKSDIFTGSIPAVASTGSRLGSRFKEVPVKAGIMLPMIGGGAADATVSITTNSVYVPSKGKIVALSATSDVDNCNVIAEPSWMYRVFLGIGPDCELITTGYAQAAGLCPSFERGAEETTAWGYYCVVAPRLAATVDRLGTGAIEEVTVEESGDEASGNPQVKIVPVNEAQERADFDVFCPEGHRWPETVEVWKITDTTTKP